MKNELFERKTLTAALGTVAIGFAMGAAPAFAAADLGAGYQVSGSAALQLAEGKCGEGKCGGADADTKSSEGKCGEGKCGGADADTKSSEGKCGEGKCGN
ncbi:MAG: hypothetical protein ACK4IT_10995 [Thioalkalivibrionaceae bacterium]